MKKKKLILLIIIIVLITLWFSGIIPKQIGKIYGIIYMKSNFPKMELEYVGIEWNKYFGDYIITFKDKEEKSYGCVIGPKYFPINLGQGLFELEEKYNESIVDNNDELNNNTSNNEIVSDEKDLVSLSDIMTKEEIDALKLKIEEDETNYGDNYQKFEHYSNIYKRKPDRIYFKTPDVNGFYLFDKEDKDYEHLLEVSEDRMCYSTMEDYNLYCFTPDSIDTMMKSGDTYIIFDYDNNNLSESDVEYQKNLIFRFPQSTRLYRLATYLSYFKEMIPRSKLGKTEFANNKNISGYKYIFSNQDSN